MVDPRTPPERTLCFVVPDDQDGARLDRFLSAVLSGPSRSRIQAWIEEGRVRLGERVAAKTGTPVEAGETVEVRLPGAAAPRDDSVAGERLRTIHVDEHVIVIDKPEGMLAHPTGEPRGRSVSELARREFGDLPSLPGTDRPGIVHRLDAGTSGIMVLARTPQALASLQAQFRARSVEKVYTAIVHGEVRFDSDWIEASIGRHPAAREKRVVVAEGQGRAASTYYEVRERLRGFALIECRPKTGRTHQIRVHLAHVGHPIVGDRTYKHHGPLKVPLSPAAPQLARQALHASSLSFEHPASGERVRFEAPLPADMAALLAWLREHHGR